MPGRIFAEQDLFGVNLIRMIAIILRMPDTPISRVRVDKWLWAVRVFKTRSLAAEACRRGRVTIDGQPAKASREVSINNVVVVAGEVPRRFKVLQPLSVRVGAARVRDYAEDQAPFCVLERRDVSREAFAEIGRASCRERV